MRIFGSSTLRLLFPQTGRTFIARLELPFLAIQAIDRLGHQAGKSRFADGARAAKKIGMGDLARADLVLQSNFDMILPDSFLKSLRPIFSI